MELLCFDVALQIIASISWSLQDKMSSSSIECWRLKTRYKDYGRYQFGCRRRGWFWWVDTGRLQFGRKLWNLESKSFDSNHILNKHGRPSKNRVLEDCSSPTVRSQNDAYSVVYWKLHQNINDTLSLTQILFIRRADPSVIVIICRTDKNTPDCSLCIWFFATCYWFHCLIVHASQFSIMRADFYCVYLPGVFTIHNTSFNDERISKV